MSSLFLRTIIKINSDYLVESFKLDVRLPTDQCGTSILMSVLTFIPGNVVLLTLNFIVQHALRP